MTRLLSQLISRKKTTEIITELEAVARIIKHWRGPYAEKKKNKALEQMEQNLKDKAVEKLKALNVPVATFEPSSYEFKNQIALEGDH
jgi:hypothetical protein